MGARLLVFAWLVIGLLGGARAEAAPAPASDWLAQAATAYEEAMATEDRTARLERFRHAERLFASIVREHSVASASLYVNWGNAALQAQRLGPAILAYRRALVLDPGDVQARENLAEARGLLPTWVPTPEDESLASTFFFWLHAMSRSARLGLAAFFFLLSSLLLAVWIRWGTPWARNLALLPLLLWLALVSMPLLETSAFSGEEAVVTADEVIVRAADSPGAPTKFAEPLPGGAEVGLIETRGDWARIRLVDGRDGWLSRGSLTRTEPGE